MKRFGTDCFVNILYQAMVDKNIKSFAELESLLIEKDYPAIHKKRISAYLNGYTTPSFEKAKALLSVLDWDISDIELIKALEENRRVISSSLTEASQNVLFSDVYGTDDSKTAGWRDREKKITIRLRYTDLVPGNRTVNAARAVIMGRLQELYGDSNAYAKYIRALIKADLANYIIDDSKELNTENED